MDEFNKSYVGLRLDLLKYIKGTSLAVLDVGCATGINGLYLKDRNIASLVVGIEVDEKMAAVARKNIDHVIICDLNKNDIRVELKGYSFDFILLGDILEHLMNPWDFMRHLVLFLKEKGKVIISVPNIQHIETIIQLYVNKVWPYNERGIFDKTHVRFFTYKNIVDLIEKSDMRILNVERKYRYRDAVGSCFPKWNEKVLKLFFPNLFTFQYIVVCEKSAPSF